MQQRFSAITDGLRTVRRRVGSVVSPGAVLVGGLCVLGWWGAATFEWVEAAWIATSALVLLVLCAAFLVRRSEVAADFELDRSRVSVGDEAGGFVVVRNVGQRRMLPMRVELAVDNRTATFEVPSLAGGEEHRDEYLLPTHRRRLMLVGPVRTVQGDPLGLLRRTNQWGDSVPFYVHPTVARLDQLGAGFLRDLEGRPTNDISNSDIAFHALREYQPGDDRRFVHWKTTARIGQLMIREFVDTRRSHLGIVLDTRPESYASPDEFELAVSLAASLAVRAVRDEQSVTLVTGAGLARATDGRSMLDTFAGIELGARHHDLDGATRILVRASAGLSIVGLVSGSRCEASMLQSATRRAGADVRTLVVRARSDGPTAVRPIGSSVALDIAALDDFAYAIWRVTQW